MLGENPLIFGFFPFLAQHESYAPTTTRSERLWGRQGWTQRGPFALKTFPPMNQRIRNLHWDANQTISIPMCVCVFSMVFPFKSQDFPVSDFRRLTTRILIFRSSSRQPILCNSSAGSRGHWLQSKKIRDRNSWGSWVQLRTFHDQQVVEKCLFDVCRKKTFASIVSEKNWKAFSAVVRVQAWNRLNLGHDMVMNIELSRKAHFVCSLPCAQCKPAKAISIIEADVNVDFAPPKDYKVRKNVTPRNSRAVQLVVEIFEDFLDGQDGGFLK